MNRAKSRLAGSAMACLLTLAIVGCEQHGAKKTAAPAPAPQASAAASAPAPAAASADPSSSPRSRPAFVQILTPTGGVDFSEYLRPLVEEIRSSWMQLIPDEARQGKKGRTSVCFGVAKTGQFQNITIESSSGSDVLDAAAADAIRRVDHSAPLPASFNGPSIPLRFIFLYNLPATPENIALKP